MSDLIKLLNERRTATWELGKKILDRAEAEHRELSGEEQQEFHRIEDDLDSINQRLAKIAERARGEAELSAAFAEHDRQPVDRRHYHETEGSFGARIRESVLSRSLAPIDVRFDGRSGYSPGIERRDLLTTSGGGMVGTTFYDQIVRHLVEGSAVLAAGAHLVTTDSGEPLAIPKTTADSTAAIISEGGSITESDPTLGSVTLGAYKYGFSVQISREFAEDASFDVQSYLAEQSGRALANAFGTHAITGDGSSKPRGVVTDATLGVTGGTGVAGAFTSDNLIDLYHSVAEPYARSAGAAWLMRSTTLAAVRKLKASGTGNYLFDIEVPANYPGAAGMLLGRPVFIDPNVAAVATSAKSVLFGDFSKYWVRQVNGIRFERSDDYAFANDLVTFRALWRADGSLIDTTGAIKYLAGGAS